MTLQDQYNFEGDNQSVFTVKMRQRLTNIAAAGIVCTLLGWIFAPLNSADGIVESGTSNNIPAMNDKVFRQGVAHYHWMPNCPLANSRSHRVEALGHPRPRVSMLRSEAEAQKLHPCSFCRDGSQSNPNR